MTTAKTLKIEGFGKPLVDIIRELIGHPAAKCKLPRGLWLMWRRNGDGTGEFRAIRANVLPSDIEIETVKRDAKAAGVLISGLPTLINEPARVDSRELYWKGYCWTATLEGTQNELPLWKDV